ncbi:MAG: hypothetical protein IKQ16_02335 [Lentisphaeria bacterium]|nr:hypothetical protein [Lentisphaeria bacterium]
MSEKAIEISGGKMFVGGVEFQKIVGEDDVVGEDVLFGAVGGDSCIISAGVVYVNDTCVGSIPYEDFKAWRDGANEEV